MSVRSDAIKVASGVKDIWSTLAVTRMSISNLHRPQISTALSQYVEQQVGASSDEGGGKFTVSREGDVVSEKARKLA
mgnify:CR=1 FL=1